MIAESHSLFDIDHLSLPVVNVRAILQVVEQPLATQTPVSSPVACKLGHEYTYIVARFGSELEEEVQGRAELVKRVTSLPALGLSKSLYCFHRPSKVWRCRQLAH